MKGLSVTLEDGEVKGERFVGLRVELVLTSDHVKGWTAEHWSALAAGVAEAIEAAGTKFRERFPGGAGIVAAEALRPAPGRGEGGG